MRALLSLITMGLLAAQDLPIGESRHPQPIKPFDLNYFDIRTAIYDETKMTGRVMTEFFVDEPLYFRLVWLFYKKNGFFTDNLILIYTIWHTHECGIDIVTYSCIAQGEDTSLTK